MNAINSVLAQTIDLWELIVIDNQSEDGTQQRIAQIDDQRIRLFTIQNFGSISKSRNLGINNAVGEWIAFLDSDDWWEPNKLEICMNSINENVDFIYHDLKVESRGRYRQDLVCRDLKSPIFLDLLRNGNPIATSSVVAKKSLFSQVNGMNENIEMNTTADYNTWLKMSLVSEGFLHLPRFLGFYRFHDDNLSTDNIFDANLVAISEFFPLLSQANKRRAISNLGYTQARVNFLAGNYDHVNSYAIASFSNAKLEHKIKLIYLVLAVLLEKLKKGKRK